MRRLSNIVIGVFVLLYVSCLVHGLGEISPPLMPELTEEFISVPFAGPELEISTKNLTMWILSCPRWKALQDGTLSFKGYLLLLKDGKCSVRLAMH